MSAPDFKKFEEVEASLAEQESYWLLYEEFQEGLNEMANQDWITFR